MIVTSIHDHPTARLTRRGVLVTGGLATTALLAGCQTWEPQPTYATGDAARREAALPPSAPTLYVVNAPECPWCRWWHATHEEEFEKSEARTRLRYVKLMAPRIPDSVTESTWPKEDRWVWRMTVENRLHGTPLFVLVKDRKFIVGGNNAKLWATKYWPEVQRATGLA